MILVFWNGYPARVHIIFDKTAEIFFKLYDIRRSQTELDFTVIYVTNFRSLNFDNFYEASKFECDITHKYQFIKCVVGEYIAIRATHISQDITLDQYDKISRQ